MFLKKKFTELKRSRQCWEKFCVKCKQKLVPLNKATRNKGTGKENSEPGCQKVDNVESIKKIKRGYKNSKDIRSIDGRVKS